MARHRSKNVLRYKQGDINFILNMEPRGQAAEFRGSTVRRSTPWRFGCATPPQALKLAVAARRQARCAGAVGPMELNIPAIEGIGGSYLYLVDRYGAQEIYDVDFVPIEGAAERERAGSAGLTYIDHLTHNVHRGNMQTWADFYERMFNFREIRYFDIEGKVTGLFSKAMTSPDGKIRIPLNESQDDKSQIEEFLHDYKGEGIQHVALGTDDIYATVDRMRARGVQFQDTPDTYFEALDARVPGHGEDLARLRERRILIDGAPTQGQGLLLQIFTQNMVGPMLLRDHPAQGQRGLRRGQLQGAVRIARARPGAPRRAVARPRQRRGVMNERRGRRGCASADAVSTRRASATISPPKRCPARCRSRTRRSAVPTGCTRSSSRARLSPRRAANRRSWLYRIRPAAVHQPFVARSRRAASDARFRRRPPRPRTSCAGTRCRCPRRRRISSTAWSPWAATASRSTQSGCAIHVYAANRSMRSARSTTPTASC